MDTFNLIGWLSMVDADFIWLQRLEDPSLVLDIEGSHLRGSRV